MYKQFSETDSIVSLLQIIEDRGKKNIFSPEELLEYSKKADNKRLAVRYIAKKIIFDYYKGNIELDKISILNDSKGKPIVSIKNADFKNYCIYVSLSHSNKHVTAFVVIYE